MIKTIIFDLAEVYLKGIIGVEEHLEPLFQISKDKIYDLLKGQNFINLMNGKISEEKYLENILSKNNFDVSIINLKDAIRKNFLEIEGTREIILELKNKNFKLGLLSVHCREWINYCNKKFNYHELFDSISYSFETSVCKPDKKAFKIILEKLDTKPEECLFIDDSLKNIQSAQELGLNTIHFKNPVQLKEELISFGVL
ncbi:MAG: HAD family phosphatase [Candidatus Pacearchaeota archaeon]|jgi:HAD superfamily hydrolase (TIGR01509 family)